jgi:hypothetical protein
MSSTGRRRRGKRPVHLRDWPFGAVGRRLLLEALLLDEQPADGWTRQELQTRIGVTNGGLDDLLAGVVDLGLAEITTGRVRATSAAPDLMKALGGALRAAQKLPDRPVHALPRRPYQSR